MICNKDEHESHFLAELHKPYEVDLRSALTGPRLMRAVLEVLASGLVKDLEETWIFLEQTLVYQLASEEKCEHKITNFDFRDCLRAFVSETLKTLEQMNFITPEKKPTHLGKAAFASCIPPE